MVQLLTYHCYFSCGDWRALEVSDFNTEHHGPSYECHCDPCSHRIASSEDSKEVPATQQCNHSWSERREGVERFVQPPPRGLAVSIATAVPQPVSLEAAAVMAFCWSM
eukprot:4966925-Amphidinium_carterae.1